MRTSAPILELEPDGAAGRLGEVGIVEPDTAQSTQQDISHRVERQAQLVGPHGGRRGRSASRSSWHSFDPVLHLAAGAVDLLVEILGLALVAPQRGDHKAGIGFPLRPLCLGHDAAPAAPAPPRHPHQALKREAAAHRLLRHGGEIKLAAISRQAARCAPTPNGSRPHWPRTRPSDRPAQSPKSAHADANLRPTDAEICATMRAISSTAPSAASRRKRAALARSRLAPAEHVEGQIVVAIVVAVEKSPLLLAVHPDSSVASRSRMISFWEPTHAPPRTGRPAAP